MTPRAKDAGSFSEAEIRNDLRGGFRESSLVPKSSVRAVLEMPPSRDPARFEIHGKMPLSVLTGKGGVPIYPGKLRLASGLAPVAERTTPVLMTVRPDLEWTMEVMLGGSGDVLPRDVAEESRFGSFDLQFKEVAGGYTVTGSLHLESQLVEPEAVPQLRRFLLSVEEAMDRPVEVR